MNGNVELLNFICQNAEMGVNTLGQLLTIVEDAAMKARLTEQQQEYADVLNEGKRLLNANGCDEKSISALDRIKTYLMISVQTVSNRTNAHIAEMLITGSNMGVLDANKQLKRYPNAETDIVNLMQRLLRFEENNVQELKQFL